MHRSVVRAIRPVAAFASAATAADVTKRIVGAVALVAVMVTPNRAATPSAVTLAVAGRSNATVSIASDGRLVAAVWAGSMPAGQTDIYAALSRDGGQTFSAPVRVNSAPGDARVNGEQPPHVVLTSRLGVSPAIVVVWTSKNAKGGTLLTSRSEDGGRTFSPTTSVPGADAAGNRGWESVAVDPAGRVSALWLDHRQLVKSDGDMASMHHETGAAMAMAKPDGVTMAQQSQLYFASLDAGVARPLTGGVCYCCKTSLIAGPGGALYAAWRHVYPGNFRDMAFAMSSDGGRTFTEPIRVSEDKWQIEGCPEDGPTLARARDGRVHIVWPTIVNDGPAGSEPTIGLFHASSADGKSFSPRVRILTEGLPHHPQLTIAANGSLALSWDELIAGKRRVVLAQGVPASDGTVAFSKQILSAADPGSYPVVAATPDGVVTAWSSRVSETSSVIRVERRPWAGPQTSHNQ